MGYHDSREIPNYWAYAKKLVLQDHMFELNYDWSLPAHLVAVSAWSAKCERPTDASSCRSDHLEDPPRRRASVRASHPDGSLYGWTDLTYPLHEHGVSWGYDLFPGKQPDCDDGAAFPGSTRSAADRDAERLEPAPCVPIWRSR